MNDDLYFLMNVPYCSFVLVRSRNIDYIGNKLLEKISNLAD